MAVSCRTKRSYHTPSCNQSKYIAFQDIPDNGAIARQGWIGMPMLNTNNVFQWYSDVGEKLISLDRRSDRLITTGATKTRLYQRQYYQLNSNAFRMIYGNYGAFWRNDGDVKKFIFCLLPKMINLVVGTYRPFIYDLTQR